MTEGGIKVRGGGRGSRRRAEPELAEGGAGGGLSRQARPLPVAPEPPSGTPEPDPGCERRQGMKGPPGAQFAGASRGLNGAGAGVAAGRLTSNPAAAGRGAWSASVSPILPADAAHFRVSVAILRAPRTSGHTLVGAGRAWWAGSSRERDSAGFGCECHSAVLP